MVTKQEKAAVRRAQRLQATILNHPSHTPLAMKFKAAVLAKQMS